MSASVASRGRVPSYHAATAGGYAGWSSGRADEVLAGLRQRYLTRGREPVPVSFRSLVPEMNATERATHLIHPYPAKLLRHIPFLFLASQEVCRSSGAVRSEEHTSELQSLMRISYAVFCLKKQNNK